MVGDNWLMIIGFDDRWWMAIGGWQLVDDNRLMTIGGWQLVGGKWLMTIS